MPKRAPQWRALMAAARSRLPAGPFRSLDVSRDHRAFARRSNPKSSCAEGFGPRRRVKPGGDDVGDGAAAMQRLAAAKRYAGPVWLWFVGAVETANLDRTGVFHAGPMRALLVAAAAHHANLRQRTCALRGLRAFGRILRPSADAHERARSDDRRKQYRTSHGHDLSPIDVVRDRQRGPARTATFATLHREPSCGPRRPRRQLSRRASDSVHAPQSEVMSQ